jgi:putative ABC transport system permease protein
MYLKIAWRNIWRNKRRTFITIASVFFAVVLAIVMRSTITGVFEKMVRDIVGISSGYIQIHKQGYWNERSVDNTFEENDSIIRWLNENKEILYYTPRLESFSLASSGTKTKGVMVSGIYPEYENNVTRLKDKLISGEFISGGDKHAIIPEGLAKYLQLKINDTIVLIGQGFHGSIAAGKFPIKGIIRIGSPELNKSMCWLPINTCRELLGTGKRISSISLLLAREKNLEQVQQKLISKTKNEDFEIMTWKEMLPDLDQFVEADSSAHIITINLLYLIIAFGIFGTLLMMINERRHEFGILIAIGMRKGILIFIVFIETLMMAGLGALTGIAGAIPVVLYLHYHPIQFTGELAKAYEGYGMEPVIPTSLDTSIYLSQASIVFLIIIIISTYPFYKIHKINLIKAINS